ncbi:MAG: hypothetical protein D6726_10425 [Nitrospirae bacterium]|nr:MAG: hypothetical protein D6726_10425 [Nitrospirota bacterium]
MISRPIRWFVPVIIVVSIFLCSFSLSWACVGKIINIGVTGSQEERLLAELISVLINERTGTTVNVMVMNEAEDIYPELRDRGSLGMMVERLGRARQRYKTSGADDYAHLKKEARKEGLIYLKPLGNARDGSGDLYIPVITEYILVNFPALPRVVNKLRGITDDRAYEHLLRDVSGGSDIRKAVRRFLRKKRLI